MKKLLILMLVLGVASAANATLLISVDGVVDPEDTSITLLPSETVVIDIMGDDRPPAQAAFLIIQGPGSIAGYAMLYPGVLAEYQELEEFAAGAGMAPAELLAALDTVYGYTGASDLSFMMFADLDPFAPLSGKLVDEIIFHCEGPLLEPADVILSLVDGNLDVPFVFDTQIIHQVPEPMTVMLLGLGGLFLRRRK